MATSGSGASAIANPHLVTVDRSRADIGQTMIDAATTTDGATMRRVSGGGAKMESGDVSIAMPMTAAATTMMTDAHAHLLLSNSSLAVLHAGSASHLLQCLPHIVE